MPEKHKLCVLTGGAKGQTSGCGILPILIGGMARGEIQQKATSGGPLALEPKRGTGLAAFISDPHKLQVKGKNRHIIQCGLKKVSVSQPH
jgi:hypothetical protein